MDKLAAMRTFVDIVDRGSLTAAAEAQDRSLSTVVRTLSRLEKALGTRLIHRTTRRMSLTAEGREYLERCRRILSDVHEAELSVAQRQSEPEGEIRMTAPQLFGQSYVAPLVTGFLIRYPKVEMEMILLDRVVNLVDEGVDLAVRIGELKDASMNVVPIGRMRRVVCASPALLSEHGTPRHPEELVDRPCVRFRGNSIGGQWHFLHGGREVTVPVRGPIVCNQATVAAQACADGLGFGHLLHYQVAPFEETGQLEIVLAEFEPKPVPVSLVYPETTLVSSRLRTLVAWLGDALRERIATLNRCT